MIIWISGLSGSGKTTIGCHLAALWKKKAANVVIVDGDRVRQLLDLGDYKIDYTIESRRYVAEKIHTLCAWLDEQDVNVVCCTISLFDELHLKNRRIFSKYFEVLLSVPIKVLYERDDKNLYAPALRGDIKNVVGVDIPFSPPSNPDMIIDNCKYSENLEAFAAEILDKATAS